MENKITQHQIILEHLNNIGGLTSYYAMVRYGIGRLATRVFELKKMGYPIKSVYVESENRRGTIVRYVEYRIDKENDNA